MRSKTIALAFAALVLGTAGEASAQGRNRDAGWWPWEGGAHETVQQRGKKAKKNGRAHQQQYHEDVYAQGQGQRRGNGPPFCRNGQGHPVHGMDWCRRKGWAQAGWGDVVYHDRIPSDGRVDQPRVRDILGSVILDRLTQHSRRLGATGPIEGRSFLVDGASVLQLRASGIPIAELTDRNRDGRVDLVLLAGS